jgi:hypothetical protein
VTEGAREQDRVVGGRSTRASAVLAWSLAAASLVLLLTAETLSYLSRSAAPATVDGANWLDYGFTLLVAAYLTVGALVASRRPRNAVSWLLCAVGLATAVETFTDKYAPYADAMDLAGAKAAAFLYDINPGILLAIFVPLLFPDGRLPSRRWRPVVWLVGTGVLLYVVDAALEPGGPDPLGVELPSSVYGVLAIVSIVSLIVGIFGAGPPLLQEQVRCQKDPRSLRHQTERPDGPGGTEQGTGGPGIGDDAASPRFAVVAPSYSFEG